MILCSANRIFFLCLVLGRLCVRDISSILTGSLRYFLNDVQSVSLWNFLALLYSRCFLKIFFMSLVIQGSEYRLEEYLKGMNWFIISWRLCLKRSQSGSGESVSGAWF